MGGWILGLGREIPIIYCPIIAMERSVNWEELPVKKRTPTPFIYSAVQSKDKSIFEQKQNQKIARL